MIRRGLLGLAAEFIRDFATIHVILKVIEANFPHNKLLRPLCIADRKVNFLYTFNSFVKDVF